jgi:hypothetical protein
LRRRNPKNHEKCSECGHSRFVTARTKDGKPLCNRCYKKWGICKKCKEKKVIKAGGLCNRCYQQEWTLKGAALDAVVTAPSIAA